MPSRTCIRSCRSTRRAHWPAGSCCNARRSVATRAPSVRLHEVVLAHPLDQEEAARPLAGVGDVMHLGRRHPGGLPGAELMARRRIARLDEHQALEPVVMVGYVAVPVPGNRFARIQRVLAHQHVAAFRDDMELAHLVGLRSRLAHGFLLPRSYAPRRASTKRSPPSASRNFTMSAAGSSGDTSRPSA